MHAASAGSSFTDPLPRQASDLGRTTRARYSFCSSSRPTDLPFKNGRTSPLGYAYGSHVTQYHSLAPETKLYAAGDQENSAVENVTSAHSETRSELLTSKHPLSPTGFVLGTSQKSWKFRRQTGTVQRTIPQQSSPAADPLPALQPPESPPKRSPPYIGAGQIEDHVQPARRLRFNFGERPHGGSEPSAMENAGIGMGGSGGVVSKEREGQYLN